MCKLGRPTKIIKDLLKDHRILIFKVFFSTWRILDILILKYFIFWKWAKSLSAPNEFHTSINEKRVVSSKCIHSQSKCQIFWPGVYVVSCPKKFVWYLSVYCPKYCIPYWCTLDFFKKKLDELDFFLSILHFDFAGYY